MSSNTCCLHRCESLSSSGNKDDIRSSLGKENGRGLHMENLWKIVNCVLSDSCSHLSDTSTGTSQKDSLSLQTGAVENRHAKKPTTSMGWKKNKTYRVICTCEMNGGTSWLCVEYIEESLRASKQLPTNRAIGQSLGTARHGERCFVLSMTGNGRWS